MMTKFEKEMIFTWTDGGNPSSSGYFDGAGELNNVFTKMFAGNETGYDTIPIHVNIMDDIKLGSKVKLKIIVEIDELNINKI